jgi:protein TonB
MNSIRWDDMVFANRNQMYGAYLLRKAYSRRVTMAFALSLSVVMILLAHPMISKLFESEAPPEVAIDHGKTITLPPPPPIELDVVIPPPRVTVPDQVRFVPPIVTQEDVDDVPPTIQELQTSLTSDQTIDGDAVVVDQPAVEVITPAADDPTKVWINVEQQPEFPGGMAEMMKFLSKNIKYPATARRMEMQGSVFISFVINADGTIGDIETLKGVFADLDVEAMRVIGKMPLWKPGKQNGKAVRVKFVLPVKFKLDK